jgi:hypothetical protein
MTRNPGREFVSRVRQLDTDQLPVLLERLKAEESVPLRVLLWVSGEYARRIRSRLSQQ